MFKKKRKSENSENSGMSKEVREDERAFKKSNKTIRPLIKRNDSIVTDSERKFMDSWLETLKTRD